MIAGGNSFWMTMTFSISDLVRWCVLSLSIVYLAACGGVSGFEPTVTAVQPQNLMYGSTATILVGGSDLRASMVADLGVGCTSPSFSTSSSTSLAQLNCQVKTTGELPLKISDASGQVIYQGKLTVPNPQVQLTTSKGNIVLELDPAKAPVSVDNFLAYVKAGFYSNTIFHRVIPGFVVQGGGFTSGLVQPTGLKSPIALESNNGLRNLRGTLAMARTNEPGIGHLAVFRQPGGQRLSGLQGPQRTRQKRRQPWLRRVRQGRARPGRDRQHRPSGHWHRQRLPGCPALRRDPHQSQPDQVRPEPAGRVR